MVFTVQMRTLIMQCTICIGLNKKGTWQWDHHGCSYKSVGQTFWTLMIKKKKKKHFLDSDSVYLIRTSSVYLSAFGSFKSILGGRYLKWLLFFLNIPLNLGHPKYFWIFWTAYMQQMIWIGPKQMDGIHPKTFLGFLEPVIVWSF